MGKRKPLIGVVTVMNETETNKFRALIQARLDALEREDARGKDAQSVVTLDQQSVGRLSRMDALQSQSMAKGLQARRNAQRVALKQALSRLDSAEFGSCLDCGDDIALKRLEFDPSAFKCISCASE